MTRFELPIYGVGSDHSTNCATTTAHNQKFVIPKLIIRDATSFLFIVTC